MVALGSMIRVTRVLAAALGCLVWFQPDVQAAKPAEEIVSSRSNVEERIAGLEARILEILKPDRLLASITDDAVRMYFLWPAIDGLLSLYEATGKSDYVGYAISWAKRYRDLGKDIDGDGYLDWDSSWIEGRNHGHVEWRAADGIARAVALVLTDPGLAAHKTDAETLLGFLEKHVWEKWSGGYNDSGQRTSVTHFIGRMGIIALGLHRATGRDEYLDYVERKGRELKAGLHVNERDAYIWYTYAGGQRGRPKVIDTSHAGDTVNFIAEAHRSGLVFDDVDIRRLVHTVKRNLWNGSLDSPQFQDYIHGEAETSKWSTGGFGRVGKNQGGWIKLAQFDDELMAIYTSWVANGEMPGGAQTAIHIFGNLARAHRGGRAHAEAR